MNASVLVMIGGPGDGQTFALPQPMWRHGVLAFDKNGQKVRYDVHQYRFSQFPETTFAALISPDMKPEEATSRVLTLIHQDKITAI